MKFFYTAATLVMLSLLSVQCAKESTTPMKAAPNGELEVDNMSYDLYTMQYAVEGNLDRSQDSNVVLKYNRHELSFMGLPGPATTIDTITIALGAPMAKIDLYIPNSKTIENGVYFSPANNYCLADSAEQSFFCGMMVGLDADNSGSLDSLEASFVKEGVLKVSRNEGDVIFDFKGASELQESVSLRYSGSLFANQSPVGEN